MNILDNELVLKYFECKFMMCSDGNHSDTCEGERSYRILRAMQEPIKNGEKYLECNRMGCEIRIREKDADGDIFGPHFYELKIPDRFQKQEPKEEMIEKWKHDAWMREALMRRAEQRPTPEPELFICKYYAGQCQHPGCKPTPEPEKCFCGGDDLRGHIPTEGHSTHKPKDEVEEKISSIIRMSYCNSGETQEKDLRELVELARKK